MKTPITLFAALLLLAFSQKTNAQAYVNAAATGNNDGTSWADAYTELADALDNYSPGDEIWVAAGTYLPQQPSAWPGEPEHTFYIYQDVKLYGGFNGTETMRSERDPAANVTTLSGDLNGDDVPGDFEANRADNAFSVVLVDTVVTAATAIDGFTISNGHAAGDTLIAHQTLGGGIMAWGSPQIGQCRFTQNFANVGGGLYLRGEASAEGSVTDCVFEGNHAGFAAGGMGVVTNDSSKAVLISDCQFIGNTAVRLGGGMALGSASIDINNCQLTQNSSGAAGGGIIFIAFEGEGSDYQLSLAGCDFEANTSGNGGAFYYETNAVGDNNLTFTSCNFIENQAITTPEVEFPHGGALTFLYYGENNPSRDSITITDCVLQGNSGERTGGGITFWNPTGTDNFLEIRNSQFLENTSNILGGGLYLQNYGAENIEVNFNGCLFESNSSTDGAGVAYYSYRGTHNKLQLTSCDFIGNQSLELNPGGTPDGAGFYVNFFESDDGGSPRNDTIRVVDCTWQGNTAENWGGGIIIYNGNGTDNYLGFSSCLFSENDSEEGGGALNLRNIGANNFRVDMADCDFEGNTTANVGGGIQFQNNSGMGNHFQVNNCNFLNNHADVFGGGFRMESQVSDASLAFEDCLFDGNSADIDGGGLEVVHVQLGDGQITVKNTDFLNNSSPNEGAGLNFYLEGQAKGSLSVEGALFSGNSNGASGSAEEGAGGFSLNNFGNGLANVNLQACIFENNSSADGAGAINLYKIGTATTDTVRIENCLLNSNNGGGWGGGIGVNGRIGLTLANNTIADNLNGGIIFAGSALKMQNNILHNPGLDNFLASSTSGNVTSLGGNLIGDNSMDTLLNNTDQPGAVPMFVPGTYQLSEDSPSVDAGVLPDSPSATDLAGNARLQGSCIDIGAYESPYDADVAECLALTDAREVIAAPSMISVFPNPVGDIAHISIENEWAGELNLRIVNALGKVVRTAEFDKYDQMMVLEFDTSDLPKGLYRALLSNGETVAVGSFVRM